MKKLMSHTEDLYHIRITDEDDTLTSNDKEFILENYVQPKMYTEYRRRMSTILSSVLAERMPMSVVDYEYRELESLLSQFGKIWNFDIFFLYDTVQKDITLVG
jgi:hypothetical protein